jgi:hypothetical protein
MVKVMRGRVLEDGLIHLNKLGRNMRQRIVVNYLTQAGTKESGIDVGGLFKEFWTGETSFLLSLVLDTTILSPTPHNLLSSQTCPTLHSTQTTP